MKAWNWEATDGVSIYVEEHSPPTPKAVVVVVHGFGEHIGRYQHVIRQLNEASYAVIGNDRRGHGLSAGKRGHTPNYELLMDEISMLVQSAIQNYPSLPVFLYGHSQGGNLVMSYVLRRKPTIAGVIATAPWIQLAFQPPAYMEPLGRMMKSVWPSFSQPNNLNPSHLTHDESIVQAYVTDPKVVRTISAAMGIAMLESAKVLDQFDGVFPLPLLLMHGDQDMVTSPAATRKFAARVEGDITHKEWLKMYHEIHNEIGGTEPIEFMMDWMEETLVKMDLRKAL